MKSPKKSPLNKVLTTLEAKKIRRLEMNLFSSFSAAFDMRATAGCCLIESMVRKESVMLCVFVLKGERFALML